MSKCGFPVSQNGFHPGHSRTARLWLLRLFVTGLLTTFALHWALAGKLWIKSSDFQKNKQTNSFLGFWSCVVVSVGLCFGSSLIVLFIYIYLYTMHKRREIFKKPWWCCRRLVIWSLVIWKSIQQIDSWSSARLAQLAHVFSNVSFLIKEAQHFELQMQIFGTKNQAVWSTPFWEVL